MKEEIISIFRIILIIFVSMYLILFLIIILQNSIVEQNCSNVKLSGYETNIKHIFIVGIDMFDCFVKVDGNFVPYDRWYKIKRS